MLFDKISYIIEKHEVIYSIRMTIVCAQNVLEINSKVLKRCWIIIESLKMIVCALYAREKWQSWNVNYYFLTTKFFDNSQSTHPHLPSKLGTSSWNNLNLCSKQLWCQIVFRHVGQIKSWGPNSFVHFGPHTAIYLTFAFDFTEHNSLNDLMTVLGACFLIVWRVHRFTVSYFRPSCLCKIIISWRVADFPNLDSPKCSSIACSRLVWNILPKHKTLQYQVYPKNTCESVPKHRRIQWRALWPCFLFNPRR